MTEIGKYRRIIEQIDQLPALPAITTRLIQTVNSSDSSAEDAAALIEEDPALTGAVLKMANSAFYGRPRSVSSVASAVVVLGFNTIRSIVLGLSMAKGFPPTDKRACFDRNDFWTHSITSGLAGRIIAKKIIPFSNLEGETVFCGAIMHDIGKLIFEEYFNEDYYKTVSLAQSKSASLYNTEKDFLGITHAEIGAILSDKWALPRELESAIVFHHDPWNCKDSKDIAASVYLADILAISIGASPTKSSVIPKIDKRALDVLSIDFEELQECRSELSDTKDSVREFISAIR